MDRSEARFSDLRRGDAGRDISPLRAAHDAVANICAPRF